MSRKGTGLWKSLKGRGEGPLKALTTLEDIGAEKGRERGEKTSYRQADFHVCLGPSHWGSCIGLRGLQTYHLRLGESKAH